MCHTVAAFEIYFILIGMLVKEKIEIHIKDKLKI